MMTLPPAHLRATLIALALTVLAPSTARPGTALPSDIPDIDPGPWPAMAKTQTPTRARWMFRPSDINKALGQLGEGGVSLEARIARFGDLWILEAPYDSVGVVENSFGDLGELLRDASGTPSLVRTTALVGARPQVWDDLDLRGDSGSSIAILDSGVDTAHDDLGDPDFDNFDLPPQFAGDSGDWIDAAALGYSPDFLYRVAGWHDVTDDIVNSLGPYDYHRHGTALAGVAFGGGRLDPDSRGMAPEGRIVVVKTYNFEDRWEVWASDFLLGVDWVLNHAAEYRVRACLVGAVWAQDLEISTAIEALLDAGIAVIAPVGNDPLGTIGYPAAHPGVIAVGATDAEGRIAGYSTPGDGSDLKPDFVAPGGGSNPLTGAILTCDNEPNDSYRGRAGTSIAAAHVAGAVSLVSQALRESGTRWRYERDQVMWLRGILSATAVEVEGAELGAPFLPRLDRGGYDPVEGFGMLQVDAAVNAVRRTFWPGDQTVFTLGSPLTSSAVWAARMPVLGKEQIRIELTVPGSADLDLMVYREVVDDVSLFASSTQAGTGGTETVTLADVPAGSYLVVVKRISGEGVSILQSFQSIGGDESWPIQLSGDAIQSPTVYDVEGDGEAEVFVTSNVSIDPSGHIIAAYRADGSVMSPFPRTFFTGSLRGHLTSPAVADLGSGVWIISGSEFGSVFAMDLAGQLPVQTQLTPNQPTTSVAVWENAGLFRLVVGTVGGAFLLDANGDILDEWVLGAAAAGPPALGDFDGDGVDEVVLSTDDGKIHVREIDGTLVSGWPVLRSSNAQLTAPALLEDGGLRVVVGERTAAGEANILAYDTAGASLPSFPLTLAGGGGAPVLAVGSVVASRLQPGGAPALLMPVLWQDAGGAVSAQLFLGWMDGSVEALVPYPVAAPAFAGTRFELGRADVSAARAGEMTSDGEAQLWMSIQVGWEEFDGVSRLRYGSVQRHVGFKDRLQDRELTLASRSAHPWDERLAIELPDAGYRVAPVITDLDGDGQAEMLVARENRIHLQGGRVNTAPLDFWNSERYGPSRRACYGCGASNAVAAAAAPDPAPFSLRAHPNPFNPRTQVLLTVPRGGDARFTLVDARGRRIRTWTRRLESAGEYREILDGTDSRGSALASGVYRLVVELAGQRMSHAVTLLR